MRRSAAFAALLLLAAAPALAAHDLFLKLTSYFVEPGAHPIRVAVLNGTFASSENAVTRDRVRDLTLIGISGTVHLGLPSWTTSRDTSFVTFPVRQAGTYVLGASTRPNTLTLSGEEFNAYLREDGIQDVLDARTKRGELGKPARERYAKHVKAVFQAGELRTRTFGTVLGYPAEIVPLANPYELHPGESLPVRCLVNGRPVANQVVIAGGEPPAPPATASANISDSARAADSARGADSARMLDSVNSASAYSTAGTVQSNDSVSDAGTVVTPDSARAADSAGATSADSAAPQRPKYPTAVVRSLGSTGGGRVITVAPSGSSLPQQTLRTDANGVARISLTAPGKWYVKFVHMAPAAGDATVDYESQWATLTFELR